MQKNWLKYEVKASGKFKGQCDKRVLVNIFNYSNNF